jgi:hypothetical protein
MSEDWRVGLSCKPKYRTHDLYYERGKILKVCPSGTSNLFDKDGILMIEMESGRVFYARSDEWVTA